MFIKSMSIVMLLVPLASLCQDPSVASSGSAAAAKASAPAATEPFAEAGTKTATPTHGSSSRKKHEADDVYIQGARLFARRDFAMAQHRFKQAVRLDPDNQTYVLALLYSREAEVYRLTQAAYKERLSGDDAAAEAMLASAKRLYPANPLLMQDPGRIISPQPGALQKSPAAKQFENPINFEPSAGARSFHMNGETRQVVSDIYKAFGVQAVFDSSVAVSTPLRIEVDDVDFAGVSRVINRAAHLFAVPVDPRTALVAKDTQELREAFTPEVEDTIYLSGQTQQQIIEFANMVRTIFGMTKVAVSTGSGAIAVRGTEAATRRVHDLITTLSERSSDVLVDVNVYEVDSSSIRKVGFAQPTSASATDVAHTAQTLISNNQALLNESISSGALTLSGTAYQQELEEVAFLVAAGVSGSNSLTSILGTLGSLEGVPLLGITVSSNSLNLLLSSTDARMLNAIQMRSSNQQEVTFRVGSRYPVLSALTSSTSGGSVASELAAAGVSNSVIAQLTGSSSSSGISVPSIQFEDIGLTIKITQRVLQHDEVQLDLDFKLESLGATGVANIPVLNNRALKSSVTMNLGQTTLLAALVSSNEIKALDGLPGLDQLPGFQGSDRTTDGTKNELLITLTPHIISTSSGR